jgi:hypothetical protein
MTRRKSTEAECMPGYQDIIWLGGQVFENDEFVDRIENEGFDAIYAECPYGDLTNDQKARFEATFNRWEMKLIVRIWWVVYKHLRKHGKITGQLSAPWRP